MKFLILVLAPLAMAKEITKKELLDRARASIAADACTAESHNFKCMKSATNSECEKFAKEGFDRCAKKMDGNVKATYPTERAYLKDLFPIVACATAHVGLVAKENKKWSDAKDCQMDVPPGMAIPKE